METRKDRMAHEYVAKLHDYVKWHHYHMKHEGWIYFCDEEYVSIELGVSEKKMCELTSHHKHRKNHTLLVCHNYYWHQLEYIKSRKGFNDNSEPDT